MKYICKSPKQYLGIRWLKTCLFWHGQSPDEAKVTHHPTSPYKYSITNIQGSCFRCNVRHTKITVIMVAKLSRLNLRTFNSKMKSIKSVKHCAWATNYQHGILKIKHKQRIPSEKWVMFPIYTTFLSFSNILKNIETYHDTAKWI